MKQIFFIIVASLTLCNCSHKIPLQTNINLIRPTPDHIKTINIEIPVDSYKDALKDQDLVRRVRLVPILQREGQKNSIPEYRLFSITPDGPAGMVGLQNADILVAANDYVIYEPEKFKAYLNLLATEKDASIEIRREEQPVKLSIHFKS